MVEILLTALVALLIGCVVGYVFARRRAAQESSAYASAELSQAQLETAQAQQAAHQAREDASTLRVQLASLANEQAQLRATQADEARSAADMRAALAESQAALANSNAALSEATANARAAEAQRDAAIKRAEELAADRESMVNQFKVLSDETLERQGQKADKVALERLNATEKLMNPLAEGLTQLHQRIVELEKERAKLSAELGEQVRTVRDSGESIRKEALSLSNALRTPQVRGAWGEQSLRRMVEISGLTQRVDFDDQQSYQHDGQGFRPDMRVNMADGKFIFVDSKVPLSAILDAYNTEDEAAQGKHLETFAKHVRKHIDDLAGKNYWQLELGSPEFVVMYLGSDEWYRLAQDKDPELYHYASRRGIVLASPGTLIPLLQIVGHGWKQVALAESAAQVSALGRELFDRISTMGEHFDKLGRSLASSVKNFNSAVGTLESRVMVSARRFNDLGVTDKDLKELTTVDAAPREISVPEMLEHQQRAESARAELEAAAPEQDLLAPELTDPTPLRQLLPKTGTSEQ